MSNTAVITKDTVLTSPKTLGDYLEKNKTAIERALPAHITADRMLRLTLTAFSTTPALRNCTAHSLLASTVLAAQLGIEIGVMGQGYLIPYGKTCTFVPGWQGLVALLNNSGRATAWTGAVFEGDEFEFELGSNPKCRHIPGENYGDPDFLKAAYAVGKVNGSEMPIVECWTLARIEKHRDRYNKVGKRHYSFEQPEMYARKVVLLQVLKYLPRSIQVDNALTTANNFENGRLSKMEDGVVIDIEPAAETGAEDLANAAGEAAAAPKARTTRRGAANTPAAPQEPAQAPETPAPVETPAAPAEKPAEAAPVAKEEPAKPAPAEKPATTEAPAKMAPTAENRTKLSQEIGAALKENSVTPIEFENACRKAGIIGATEGLMGASFEKVQQIHTALGGLIEGVIAAKEGPFD